MSDQFPAPSAPRRPSFLRRRSIQVLGTGAATVAVLLFVGAGRRTESFGPPPAGPRLLGGSSVLVDAASPLDEPLRRLDEAREALRGVNDYTCVLIAQERIDGRLGPERVMALHLRSRPFSVYMRIMDPPDLAGQEVCYVAERHGDRMRVRAGGSLGVLGWLTIDQRNPRALKASRHVVAEAGLANLVDRLGKAWTAERSLNQTTVNLAEYEYNGRPCTRVETLHAPDSAGRFDHFRTVLYLDHETKLPVRAESYDYPRRTGDPGEVVEVFSYINLHCNVGLGDETFDH